MHYIATKLACKCENSRKFKSINADVDANCFNMVSLNLPVQTTKYLNLSE